MSKPHYTSTEQLNQTASTGTVCERCKNVKQVDKETSLAAKLVGALFVAPVALMALVGLLAVMTKFFMICWEWIS